MLSRCTTEILWLNICDLLYAMPACHSITAKSYDDVLRWMVKGSRRNKPCGSAEFIAHQLTLKRKFKHYLSQSQNYPPRHTRVKIVWKTSFLCVRNRTALCSAFQSTTGSRTNILSDSRLYDFYRRQGRNNSMGKQYANFMNISIKILNITVN